MSLTFKLMQLKDQLLDLALSPLGIVTIILSALLYYLIKDVLRAIHMGIPTVRGGVPFFGQSFEMLRGSPWDTMTKWVSEYGLIYRFHLFGSDCVCVADPELLKVMLQTKLEIYKKDLEWTYKPFLVLLGAGLVTADGKEHRRQRTLLSHTLRFDILDVIPDMALRAVQRLCVRLEKAKAENRAVEMAEEFRTLTLQVIAEAILSIAPEESDATFATMYLPIVEEGNKRTWNPERTFLPTSSWFKFRRDVKKLNDYVTSIIVNRWALREKEAVEGTNRKMDVLDTTLAAVPADSWNAATISQIRDEVKTFILAGHETSASMLTWALYEISKNPTFRERVLSESQEVFGASKIDINSLVMPPRSVLDKLEFTQCCLRESLRKYSVVPTVVRVNSESTKLGKYNIPRGTTIMVCMQGVHHNAEYWPEPLEYKPERFMEEIKPYTFLPFIEGPRMCLGQFLSLLESKIVLSLLVQSYNFEIVNTDDAGLKHPYMIPIIPKTGHFMKIH